MAASASTPADSLAELALAAASAAAPKAVSAGACAPLFKLSDAEGKVTALEQLLHRGPVVLHFYRGDWCRYGEQSLAAFHAAYTQVAALGAQAVAISPAPSSAARLQPVPVLHDRDLRVARSYGLAFELPESLREAYRQLGYLPTGSGEWLVPVPAVYLLDSDGVVVLATLELDYRKTYRPAPLLQALRCLQQRRGGRRQRLLGR